MIFIENVSMSLKHGGVESRGKGMRMYRFWVPGLYKSYTIFQENNQRGGGEG